jgi:transposase-like protein
MKVKLSQIIQRESKNRGINITSLARETSIPRTTLFDWNAGKLPSAKNIHHLGTLSDYFAISLNELLFDVKDRNNKHEVLFSSTFRDENHQYRLVVEKIKS